MQKLKVTLVRSINSVKPNQAKTVRALGLSRIGHSVYQPNNDAMMGMVRKVCHLVTCELVDVKEEAAE